MRTNHQRAGCSKGMRADFLHEPGEDVEFTRRRIGRHHAVEQIRLGSRQAKALEHGLTRYEVLRLGIHIKMGHPAFVNTLWWKMIEGDHLFRHDGYRRDWGVPGNLGADHAATSQWAWSD